MQVMTGIIIILHITSKIAYFTVTFSSINHNVIVLFENVNNDMKSEDDEIQMIRL